MSVDLHKFAYHSGFNAFKNSSVQYDSFAMPNSYTSGTTVTQNLQFTLSEGVAFAQVHVFATAYGEYFRYLDSAYHNQWMQIEATDDYLLLDNPVTALYFFQMYYRVNNNTVTVSMHIPEHASSFNILSSLSVPIALVEYTLAN